MRQGVRKATQATEGAAPAQQREFLVDLEVGKDNAVESFPMGEEDFLLLIGLLNSSAIAQANRSFGKLAARLERATLEALATRFLAVMKQQDMQLFRAVQQMHDQAQQLQLLRDISSCPFAPAPDGSGVPPPEAIHADAPRSSRRVPVSPRASPAQQHNAGVQPAPVHQPAPVRQPSPHAATRVHDTPARAAPPATATATVPAEEFADETVERMVEPLHPRGLPPDVTDDAIHKVGLGRQLTPPTRFPPRPPTRDAQTMPTMAQTAPEELPRSGRGEGRGRGVTSGTIGGGADGRGRRRGHADPSQGTLQGEDLTPAELLTQVLQQKRPTQEPPHPPAKVAPSARELGAELLRDAFSYLDSKTSATPPSGSRPPKRRPSPKPKPPASPPVYPVIPREPGDPPSPNYLDLSHFPPKGPSAGFGSRPHGGMHPKPFDASCPPMTYFSVPVPAAKDGGGVGERAGRGGVTRSKEEVDGAFERLAREAKEYTKRRKVYDELGLMLQDAYIQQTCPFRPQLVTAPESRSVSFRSGPVLSGAPASDRLYGSRLLRQERSRMLAAQESQKHPFHPVTHSARRPQGDSGSTFERLYRDHRERRVRKQRRCRQLFTVYEPECTFQPDTSKSKSSVRMSLSADRSPHPGSSSGTGSGIYVHDLDLLTSSHPLYAAPCFTGHDGTLYAAYTTTPTPPPVGMTAADEAEKLPPAPRSPARVPAAGHTDAHTHAHGHAHPSETDKRPPATGREERMKTASASAGRPARKRGDGERGGGGGGVDEDSRAAGGASRGYLDDHLTFSVEEKAHAQRAERGERAGACFSWSPPSPPHTSTSPSCGLGGSVCGKPRPRGAGTVDPAPSPPASSSPEKGPSAFSSPILSMSTTRTPLPYGVSPSHRQHHQQQQQQQQPAMVASSAHRGTWGGTVMREGARIEQRADTSDMSEEAAPACRSACGLPMDLVDIVRTLTCRTSPSQSASSLTHLHKPGRN
ncbi:unnamed protein product [Vitrella brassicaformis CCMP3155]|uniref:Uncharacterized protein n=3 Tax=Vitrella brassicaformis TaxID=1169539 RepID=A0A0G4ENZ3_VITBC|nr:unnamed protein product [Vitrella brassicaformis CCMP3155]|eukprot:CEL99525.1 unnamed protein product [Vitrella brassicaformis CCMP3155]